MSIVYRFDGLTVQIDETRQTVTSTWPDGTQLNAIPVDTPECRERAADLGYRGPHALWHMTRDHDLTHHLVARARGQQWSEHLRLIAQGKPSPDGGEEEAIVLLVQRIFQQWAHALAEPADPELDADLA